VCNVSDMSAALPLSEDLGERIRPLRRDDYEHLVDEGAFDDESIELLEGFLIEMSPEGPPHVFVIDRLTELLVPAVAGRWQVRIGHPLALGDLSEPEPDVAVVARGDYRRMHPRTALLIIESAWSSRRRDLGFKAKLYARYQIPEYWVVDLDAEEVVVHTQPQPDGYARITRHHAGDQVTPTTIEGVTVAVTDVLP
jgi:Uma2 family endonuclease